MFPAVTRYVAQRKALLLTVAIVQSLVVGSYLYGLSDHTPLGVPLDDAWIYFDFSRNLSEYGQFAFNEGEWSSGATSMLWTALVALGMAVGVSPVTSSIVLGLIFHILSALALYEIALAAFSRMLVGQEQQALRRGSSGRGASGTTPSLRVRRLALLLVGLYVLCGNLVWHSLSGMETSMFLSFGLLLVLAYSLRRFIWVNLFSALLIFSRIEGLALVGLCGLFELIRLLRARRVRETRPFVSMLTCVSLVVGFYVIYNSLLTGNPLPTTFASRRWLFTGLIYKGGYDLRLVGGYLKEWLLFLRVSIFTPFRRVISFGETPLLAVQFTFLLISVLLGLAQCVRTTISRFTTESQSRVIGLLLFWLVLHNLAYAILLPSSGHAGRYQAINLMMTWFFLTVGIVSLVQLLSGLVARLRRNAPPRSFAPTLYTLFILVLVGTALWSTVEWRKAYVSSVAHINRAHVESGRWADAHLPEDAVIAAFDIGAMKYYGKRRVVDIGGLIDPDFKRYRDENRVVEYIKEKGATHLAMPEAYDGSSVFGRVLGLYRADETRFKLRRLHTSVVARDLFTIHAPITRSALPRISIYEIAWTSP